MAQLVKAGAWYYRIDPKNSKYLQRSTQSDDKSFSHYTEFSGADILDLSTAGNGSDVIVETSKGRWVKENGNSFRKK